MSKPREPAAGDGDPEAQPVARRGARSGSHLKRAERGQTARLPEGNSVVRCVRDQDTLAVESAGDSAVQTVARKRLQDGAGRGAHNRDPVGPRRKTGTQRLVPSN